MKHIISIIGRGFGDEGKGLATAWQCRQYPNTLVVKHNGGGQAGHTVDLEDGRRFVFHQLSSGSFSGSATLWADSFYPDLYKLEDEINDFHAASGFVPEIYCDQNTCIVTIDDIITNMAIESLRGDNRHGSCGMGINEADLRTKAGFGIKASELINKSPDEVANMLINLRRDYYPKRFDELGINAFPEEYADILKDTNVLYNAACEMVKNTKYIQIINEKELLNSYDNIVFEHGQGLLLDADCTEYLPHVTASKTGLTNPCRILAGCNLELDEVIYVTRSYVTRHGAGRLDMESSREALGITEADQTNIANDWQGSLRYAPFISTADMLKPVLNDTCQAHCNYPTVTSHTKTSMLVTHLNETDGNVLFADKNIDIKSLEKELKENGIDKIYHSYHKFSVE